MDFNVLVEESAGDVGGWIHLAEVGDRWWALLRIVMNIRKIQHQLVA